MLMMSRLLSGLQELFSNMESLFPATPRLLVQESTPLSLALEVAI